MDHLEQVAHHEAAHSVLAILYKMGVSGGIDLHAPTSVDGAFGNTAVNLFEIDETLPVETQRFDLGRNLAVICAGAASDAKVNQIAPVDALAAQPGDYRLAVETAKASGLVDNEAEAEEVVREIALKLACRELAKPEVWEAVERVATAALEAGGKLSKQDVESLGAVSVTVG